MAIYFDINPLPHFRHAVVTAGTFDGVHKGHWAILNEVVDKARSTGGESVLITFEPHPRKLLFPDQSLGLITPLAKKLELITMRGIDNIVVVPFTRGFADLSANEYVADFLAKTFQPRHIVIGYDHRFGHDRRGNIDLLKSMAETFHYQVTEIPAQLIDEASVSSTRIRKALLGGSPEDAAQMLGRYYSLEGTVVSGRQLGRTIGYPTANIEPLDADQLVPANGIYAVLVKVNNKLHGGMLSIGFNPTVTDEKSLKIEVNIFDLEEDIYGCTLELQFVKMLRDEQKFDSLADLQRQLAMDKQDSLAILAALPPTI